MQHKMAIHQYTMKSKHRRQVIPASHKKVELFIFQLSTFQLWCNVFFSSVGVTAKAFQ